MHTKSYDYVISLGAACGTAYQIRTHFPHAKAFPLDWLITPFDSLFALIEDDFRNLAPEEHLRYGDDGIVYNHAVPLLFPHDFEKSGVIGDSHWKPSIDRANSRFAYLVNRLHDTLRTSASIAFVRHQGANVLGSDIIPRVSSEKVNRLCDLIENKYPNLDFDLFLVSGHDNDDPVPLNPRVKKFDVRYTDENEWPNHDDRWRGASEDWDTVFAEIEGSRSTRS